MLRFGCFGIKCAVIKGREMGIICAKMPLDLHNWKCYEGSIVLWRAGHAFARV